MRRWIATVFALALVVAVALPVEAHGPAALGWARTARLIPAGSSVTVTGTLRLYHIDDFADDVGADGYAVETSAGFIPLDVRGTAPEALNGARVQVRGTWHDGVVRVGVARDATAIAKLSPAPRRRIAAVLGADGQSVHLADGAPLAATSKNVAVILFGFSDDASQPYTGRDRDRDRVHQRERGRELLRRGVPRRGHGHRPGLRLVPDPVEQGDLRPVHLGDPGQGGRHRRRRQPGRVHELRLCVPQGELVRLGRARRDARQGQLEQRCIRAARRRPRARPQLRGPPREQPELHVGHEPGGDLGDLLVVGVRRPVLGDGQRQLRPQQRRPSRPVRLAARERDPDVGPGGPYELGSPLDGPAGSDRLLRIDRHNGTSLYLDVRSIHGPYFDDFSSTDAVVKGVTVRISPDLPSPGYGLSQTQLVDTTPATSTYADAPLAVGATLTDPVTGLKVTTLSASGGDATISVLDPTAPGAPGSPTATATSATSISLTWTKASDNYAVDHYRILRDGVEVATPTGLSFADAGRSPMTTYAYQIIAVDGSGNQGPAAAASAKTPPSGTDVTPPSAVKTLKASVGKTTTKLYWTAAYDDFGVAGYKVYRVGVTAPIKTVTTGKSVIVKRRNGASYYVRAYDAAGNLGPKSPNRKT